MQAIEGEHTTSFIVKAPTDTTGAARVWCGGKKLKRVVAFEAGQTELRVEVTQDNGSLLVSYPNCAEGAVVRIDWE